MAQKVQDIDVTNEAIIEVAKELGIPVEAITHSVIKQVKLGLKLEPSRTIEDAIIWAFNS